MFLCTYRYHSDWHPSSLAAPTPQGLVQMMRDHFRGNRWIVVLRIQELP